MLPEIENELKYYKEFFNNKIIFCNCDDPEYSNFYRYFLYNFEHLQLKKLITTHYQINEQSYKIEVSLNQNNTLNITKTNLNGNGDFRSNESIEILKNSDIIITNPPFSLFREYINLLIKYKKHFLIIGNINASNCKEIFPLVLKNQIWFGCTQPKEFALEFEKENQTNPIKKMKLGFARWYTNLENSKRNEKLILCKKYSENEYQKFDDYDAINIDKLIDIPNDYFGKIAVPFSFLDKYNPKQFHILGKLSGSKIDQYNLGHPVINGQQKYQRIVIERVK